MRITADTVVGAIHELPLRVGMLLYCLFCLVLSTRVFAQPAADDFNSGRIAWPISCQGRPMRYAVESVLVLPKEKVALDITAADSKIKYQIVSNLKLAKTDGQRTWQWEAPAAPGVYSIEARDGSGQKLKIQVWVQVPYSAVHQGYLGRFRIGAYPKVKNIGRVEYPRPVGFIKVTAQNVGALVSPHFRIQQFLCKQSRSFPAYVVLDERLPEKLERILEKLNSEGHPCRTLQLLSGYRTPDYNRSIGDVAYSCHQWGRAADIYVDENHNGQMDDLDGDGKSDWQDAAILSGIVSEVESETENQGLIGGMGLYAATPSHGPFVHVDVRGVPARWGLNLSTTALSGKNQGSRERF